MNPISKLNIYIAIILGICICSSCDDDTHTDPDVPDCVFVQSEDNMDGLIDETENAIMMNCFDNKLLNRAEIKSNLIGEWKIVGHATGLIMTGSQPCGQVFFTELGYTFDFVTATETKLTSGTWDIIENESENLLLKISDPNSYPLGATIFCEDYMYFNEIPVDGDVYIYEKVN